MSINKNSPILFATAESILQLEFRFTVFLFFYDLKKITNCKVMQQNGYKTIKTLVN